MTASLERGEQVRSALVAAPQRVLPSPVLEGSQGVPPRRTSTVGLALPAWPLWLHAGSPGAPRAVLPQRHLIGADSEVSGRGAQALSCTEAQ